MSYANIEQELWRHHDLSNARNNYVALVRYATLAASSHNTQPWRFELEPGRIRVFPDLSRRCPEVDPDDHHLYASLGCATENLVLAARAGGLAASVSVHEDRGTSQPSFCVEVELEPAGTERVAQFESIPERRCCRALFDNSPIATHDLQRLEQVATNNVVTALLITERQQVEALIEYVAAGNDAQFGDPAWAAEMKHWIRFNQRQAQRTGDGLYGKLLGIPDVPAWLGRAMMPLAASARGQNEKDAAHIRSSSAIAVLSTSHHGPRHWIEAGRAYERLALEATHLGLRTAFINQPVEVPEVRKQLTAFLGLGERRPDLIVRIGRGPLTPHSLRRPVEDVILRRSRAA